MKITSVQLESFRAFDEPFCLDLPGGKSLLLHGENGSGKSSIYTALQRFFELRGGDIDGHRNRFSDVGRSSVVSIRIQGTADDGTPIDEFFRWDQSSHPLPVPTAGNPVQTTEAMRGLLVQAVRRSGFLDYRSLLRTHLTARPMSRLRNSLDNHLEIIGNSAPDLDEQLFDLVTMVVLAGVRVPTTGGIERTIGELMCDVWEHRPRSRHKQVMERADERVNTFIQAFNGILPDIKTEFDQLLSEFTNHHLEIELQPVGLAWDRDSLDLTGARLELQVAFRGQVIDQYHEFLNEARLSAIATCLFLAGVRLSDSDAENPNYPRFLFLDDALIGLELQNRLPVLRILNSDPFKQYQIFILTHDRVWFDLARAYLPESNGWCHRSLIADDDGEHLVPRIQKASNDLAIARSHSQNGDLKAAAVYCRSAFEQRVQKVCEKNGIAIGYKREPSDVSIDRLWDGIVNRQKERENLRLADAAIQDFIPNALIQRINTMKSNVLNKLSHTNSPGLNQVEVDAAIDAVDDLQKHRFLPKKPPTQ